MAWLSRAPDGSALLALHVQPGAKKTEAVGLHGDALKIRLAAPPVDGKANAALIAFLAQVCGVARSDVALISGECARAKRVRISGAAWDVLERLAGPPP